MSHVSGSPARGLVLFQESSVVPPRTGETEKQAGMSPVRGHGHKNAFAVDDSEAEPNVADLPSNGLAASYVPRCAQKDLSTSLPKSSMSSS